MGANVNLWICEMTTRLDDMIVNTVWMRSDWNMGDNDRFEEAIMLSIVYSLPVWLFELYQ